VYQVDNIDSKFRLVLMAAKRAKQIIMGDKKRVDIKAENPLTIALEEILRKKITIEDLATIDHKIEEQEQQKVQEEEPDLAQILANLSTKDSEADEEIDEEMLENAEDEESEE